MPDIFFSYSSKDRDRVRVVRDTLSESGFDVFWDQQVPTGSDWDTWIRQHLAKAKCVVVFWSANSVTSDNVRHEATVAKQQGKLVPVLLQTITVQDFPMGLYSVQAANLSQWSGERDRPEWQDFQGQIEGKLMPKWVLQRISDLGVNLLEAQSRCEASAVLVTSLRTQVTKGAQAQLEAQRRLAATTNELASLTSRLEAAILANSKASERAVELSQRLEASAQACEDLRSQLNEKNLETQTLSAQLDSAKMAFASEHEKRLKSELSSRALPQLTEDLVRLNGRLTGVLNENAAMRAALGSPVSVPHIKRKRKISYRRPSSECGNCKGTGFVQGPSPASLVSCPSCSGKRSDDFSL